MRPPDAMFQWGTPESARPEAGIRAACERINASGWAWTAESCHGHPPGAAAEAGDALAPWRFPRPMVRFVCRIEHVGHLLRILNDVQRESHGWFEVIPGGCGAAVGWTWSDVNTFARVSDDDLDKGRAMYARVAELVGERRP